VPSTANHVEKIVAACRSKNTDFFILGNGSNVLFKDNGYKGVVISMKDLNSLELVGKNQIKAGAGVMLKDLSAFAMQNNLTGLEFACGIPGTVGGAVCMNAGAYDSEMKNVFISGEFLNNNNQYIIKNAEQMNFGYRASAVQYESLVVLSATFELNNGNQTNIKQKIDDLMQKREDKQPLSDPSAGSTFKRPQRHFAGKLIMDSGLAGFSIGGAAVSKKHCGFVVNTGGATAADILAVIAHVQRTVLSNFGVVLETEVKIIG